MSDNVTVSPEMVSTEVSNMRASSQEQMSVINSLKNGMDNAKATNDAMLAMDGQEFERHHGGEDEFTHKRWDNVKYWTVEITGGTKEDLNKAYRDFENAYLQYEVDYKNFMSVLDKAEKSAAEIA